MLRIELPYGKEEELIVERLIRSHLDEIATWQKFEHPFAWANFNITSKQLKDRWMVKNNRDDTLWFIIKKNDEIICRGSLIKPQEADELIFGIVLRVDLVNKGIGTQCVRIIMKMIFEKIKIDRVWLETKNDNIRAKKSWVKVGFKELGLHYRRDSYSKYSRYMGFRLKKEEFIDN